MFKAVCLNIFGIFLISLISFTLSQDQIIIEDANSNEVSRNSSFENQAYIPEALLIRMKVVRNLQDLKRLFIYDKEEESEPQLNASRGIKFAIPKTTVSKPANCQTELKPVELVKPDNSATLYWPSCVRIRRCGGCCTSSLLSCKPLETSFINITVLQMRYNHENSRLETQGTRVFPLEQHDRCSCSCRERPEDCNYTLHEYQENECRCVCRNYEEMASCTSPKKMWDPIDCICKCRIVKLCSTGSYFNVLNCRCELLRRSPASGPSKRRKSSQNLTLHTSNQYNSTFFMPKTSNQENFNLSRSFDFSDQINTNLSESYTPENLNQYNSTRSAF